MLTKRRNKYSIDNDIMAGIFQQAQFTNIKMKMQNHWYAEIENIIHAMHFKEKR